jgi:ribosomal protein S18 acetylase RimI-like enzyme
MLRKAQNSDIKYFYDLYMHPSVNPFLLYEMMELEKFRPIFEDLIQQGVLYIFEHENEPKGMVKLSPFAHRCSHIVYLGGLAIDPKHKGMGFGAKLMKEAVAFAIESGYKRIELSVSTENLNAIRLYEKIGFVKEGVYKKYSFLKSENRYIDEAVFAYVL